MALRAKDRRIRVRDRASRLEGRAARSASVLVRGHLDQLPLDGGGGGGVSSTGEATFGAGNAVGGASTGDPAGRSGPGAGTASPNPVPAIGSAVAAALRLVRK